jgi:hypothetical protein
MSKTKITGIAMVLAGLAALVTCFATGDYTHAGEGIAGVLGGFGLIFARDAVQKVEAKVDEIQDEVKK